MYGQNKENIPIIIMNIIYDYSGNINIHIVYNQNNRTKYIFFNLRKIDNRNKWKNYVIVTRVKLSVKLDVLVTHK